MSECYRKYSHSTCVLFEEMAPGIIQDLEKAGVNFDDFESKVQGAWQYCVESESFGKKGYQCNFCRFLGTLTESKARMKHWTKDLFEQTYLALEEDMLQGKAFEKLVLRAGEAEEVKEGQNSTSSKRITMGHRTLKTACRNGIVISIMFLQDDHNKRIIQTITQVAEPARLWHGEQSHTLRDVQSSKDWVVKQVTGEFMCHVCSIVLASQSEKVLDACFFSLPSNVAAVANIEMEILIDDEMAEVMGQFSLHLAMKRCQRCLWLVSGWPY
eukprot:704525-Alexandrium_andersonii.AAC.1